MHDQQNDKAQFTSDGPSERTVKVYFFIKTIYKENSKQETLGMAYA